MLVADVMSPNPMTISMDATLEDARVTLEELGFHHLLVVEDGVLVGIVSDKDILRTVSPFVGKQTERPQDIAMERRRAHQFMTRSPATVGPKTELVTAARMLLRGKYSCLPVVDEARKPVGVLTTRDFVRSLLEELERASPGASDAA